MTRGKITLLQNGPHLYISLAPYSEGFHLYPVRMAAAISGCGFMALGYEQVPDETPIFLQEDEETIDGTVLTKGTELRFDRRSSNPGFRDWFRTEEELKQHLKEHKVAVRTTDGKGYILKKEEVAILIDV